MGDSGAGMRVRLIYAVGGAQVNHSPVLKVELAKRSRWVRVHASALCATRTASISTTCTGGTYVTRAPSFTQG